MNGVNPSADKTSGGAGIHAVPALEKAIRLLNALAVDSGGGSTGLAHRLGISQSTCYRTLQTLEAADWIRQADGGGYTFSLGLLPFVRPLQGLDRMIVLLRPPMAALAEATGLSVKLSARQGFDQVTLARIESSRPLGVTSPVGARFPVVAGASGASLLSPLSDDEIDRIAAHADQSLRWDHDNADILRRRIAACRRDGVCDNLGSHPQGIDTISAPITVPHAQLALTVVGLRGDFDGAPGPTVRDLLRATARSAAESLKTVA